MKKFVFILLFAQHGFLFAQGQLSSQAKFYIVTCGPGQKELYSAFGHSAIRLHDPALGIDKVYNYGIFDFDQPFFYLNFARGYLYYRLGVQQYRNFHYYYVNYLNRYVYEQEVNLNREQTQKMYDYLEWNALPENQHYRYDYFYNNCATIIRDIFLKVLGDRVGFDGSYITTDYTIRELTDIYLGQQPWGDLGIDICLGLPMDKKASPIEYMFLPDYVQSGFDHAWIENDNGREPLISRTIKVNQGVRETNFTLLEPVFVFWFLLVLGVVFTVHNIRKDKNYLWVDAILFTIVGLLGWLLLLLWLATDHRAASGNFNLLWAIPFHIPLALMLLKKNKPGFLSNYFLAVAIIGLATLVFWTAIPQKLNFSLVPVVMLLALRAGFVYYHLKNIPHERA